MGNMMSAYFTTLKNLKTIEQIDQKEKNILPGPCDFSDEFHPIFKEK